MVRRRGEKALTLVSAIVTRMPFRTRFVIGKDQKWVWQIDLLIQALLRMLKRHIFSARNLALVYGPLSLQTEYQFANVDLEDGGSSDPDFFWILRLWELFPDRRKIGDIARKVVVLIWSNRRKILNGVRA